MRNRFIAAITILIILTLLVPSAMAASGWKFRGDLNNSGIYDDGGTRPGNNPLWIFSTGTYINPGPFVESSPAVVDGVVYVGNSYGSYYSTEGKVFAINASTGAQIWKFAAGGDVTSSPTVVDGMVYIGRQATSSSGSKLFAINASTGIEVWSLTIYQSSFNPAVANGTLYIVGNSDQYSAQGGKLYALNASTGSIVWTAGFGINEGGGGSPAIANGVVYLRTPYVYAINATTGTQIWKVQAGSGTSSIPAVVDGKVYFGSDDGKVYAINANTGATIWSYTTDKYVSSSPAVANGIVYIGSGDGKLYALDVTTGTQIWNFVAADGSSGGVVGSPAVANGVVYVGGWGSGTMYALDANTGTQIWSYKGYPGRSSPTIANGVVYFGGKYIGSDGNWAPGQVFALEDPLVSFTGTPTSGVPPFNVQFTGVSTRLGITGWNWSFGDGTLATVQNPVHTYASDGTYTVSLNVTNASGSKIVTLSKYIKAFNPASFSTSSINSSGYATNTSPVGKAPFTVTFNDTSSIKPDVWQWNFQGGVPSSSTLQNNTVVYNNPGTFNASLTVTWGVTTATIFRSVSVFGNPAVNETTVTVGDVTAGDQTTITDSKTGVVIQITPSKSSNANTLTVAVFNESAPPQTFAQTVTLVGKKIYDFTSSMSNGDIDSVKINITYTDAELTASGLNEDNLGIYYYNEVTGSWEKLTTGGIDKSLKQVWGTSNHFSIYGISASTASASSSSNTGLDSSSDSYNPATFASTAGASKTEIVNVGGGSAVTRAEMTGTGLGKNLVITSMPRSNLPTTMAAPPTTVYQYMSITSSTITGVVSETSMEFNVPQSWLTEHGYTVNDIVMMRNVDGQWQTLNTQLVSQKSGTVFYRATTPGFSYFAIAYQKGGTTMGTGTPVPTILAVAAASLTNTPAPVYSKSPVAIGPTDTQTVPSGPVTSPVNGMPLTTIVVGVIGAIAIIIGAFYVRRGLIRRQNPALFKKYD